MNTIRLHSIVVIFALGVGFLLPTTAHSQVLSQSWHYNGPKSGQRVVGAGDVDGDGYDDVITADDKGALLFRGSSSGVKKSSAWSADFTGVSWAIDSAGDVNGDGYDDVIVGETFHAPEGAGLKDGEVRVYFGSSSGLSTHPDWTASKDQRRFGFSVASAGDVNGDGYDDIVVGDPLPRDCPISPVVQKSGKKSVVYVYHGSDSGLSSSSDWSHQHDNDDGFSSCLGLHVSGAGDVNGDGFDGVLAGAFDFINPSAGKGKAYLFAGSATGLGPTPDWATTNPDAPKGKTSSFPLWIEGAGDVDGDGYDDVIATGLSEAYTEDQMSMLESRAFVFRGTGTGLSASPSWIKEGVSYDQKLGFATNDVNADGYSDMTVPFRKVSNPIDIGMFHGSARGLFSQPAWGFSGSMFQDYSEFVDSAGDVNGDGFGDVIVARSGSTSGAYVFRGGPNPAPMAQSKSVTLVQGSTSDIGLSASDIHNDSLTFKVESAPTQGSIDGINRDDGVVDYTTPADYIGPDSFTFEVQDPYGGKDTATVSISIGPGNRPPKFVPPTPSSEITTQVGETVSFTVNAKDPDGDTLSYSTSNVPQGAEFDPENREFRWSPVAEQAPGQYGIVFEVEDAMSSATRTVTISVQPKMMEDAGLDTGDVEADVAEMDTSNSDGSLDIDGSNSSGRGGTETHGGCRCAQSGGPAHLPISVICFGLVVGTRSYIRRSQ